MFKENFKNNRLGAFIVPTGIGASIGGYAGDAGSWARRFAEEMTLIVNPNVVNAGCFSGITENMLYVEGYTLDEFFKGKINLLPSEKNKVGVIFDKGISDEVLNIHINTINAVKTVYDINITYETTSDAVEVNFFVDNSGVSTGKIKNIETLLHTAKNLLQKGADAIAVVCKFKDDNENEEYENGLGVDPIGGMEAIISHYLSKELKVPTAHAPAFEDFSISTKIVNPKASAEYITPTFLPCILLGLSKAPKIAPMLNNSQDAKALLSIAGEGAPRADEGDKRIIICQRAKYLRKNSTKPEEILWYYLRDRRFMGLKFRRQVPIENYIADFVCFEKRLIIELDGSGHLKRKNIEYDQKRDTFLRDQNFEILRFYNNDIFNEIECVLDSIYSKISNTPHPQPLSRKWRGEKIANQIFYSANEDKMAEGISISDLDFLIMPYNALGSIPVFEAVKRGIKVFAIKENESVLNVTKNSLRLDNVIEVDSYQQCLETIKSLNNDLVAK